MLVKVYKGGGSRQRSQSACGNAQSDAFLAGAIQSAARSGRFSVEAGTRAAAPFSCTPFSRAALRTSFRHNREASVATLRWCSGSSRNAVRLPFGTGVQLRRNPHFVQQLHFALPGNMSTPFQSHAANRSPLPGSCQVTVHETVRLSRLWSKSPFLPRSTVKETAWKLHGAATGRNLLTAFALQRKLDREHEDSRRG
jgi:hypothetical protein